MQRAAEIAEVIRRELKNEKEAGVIALTRKEGASLTEEKEMQSRGIKQSKPIQLNRKELVVEAVLEMLNEVHTIES